MCVYFMYYSINCFLGQKILEYTAVARGQTIQQSPAGSKLGIHIIYYVVPCCTVTQMLCLMKVP